MGSSRSCFRVRFAWIIQLKLCFLFPSQGRSMAGINLFRNASVQLMISKGRIRACWMSSWGTFRAAVGCGVSLVDVWVYD